MKVLELFAGTRSIGKAFEERGHEVFSIEWDKGFSEIDWYADIGKITASDIIERFGKPDVIWASPDCSTFSVAAISHHRRKNPETGNLDPISEYAEFCDRVDRNVLRLINELSPRYWFIENPRGGLRKMSWMKDLPRYTVTYCKYGDTRMKPTDIWTNHPNPDFIPPCKNGDPCHEKAPRGSRTGTQGLKGCRDRSVIPEKLCRHIVDICERETADHRGNDQEGKGMRVLSLFDGMSCGQIAFRELGMDVERYDAYEIDKYAVAVTQHNFPDTIQGGDVFKADFKQYEGKIDWLVGGSPCFAAGTSVLTADGYKNIEDVKVGDLVLTHRLRWRKVTAIGHQPGETYTMNGCSVLNTVVTANHPYYTREKYLATNGSTGGKVKALDEPKWTEAGRMESGKTNIGIPAIQGFDSSPFSEEDCWIIGRYLADGHVRVTKRKGRKNSFHYQMILSVGDAKVDDVLSHITSYPVSCYAHTKSTHRVVFSSQRWCEFVKAVGLGLHAHEKRIPVELLMLPVEKLKALVDGYVSGDGYVSKDGNAVICTTVSRELALGLQLAVARIYGLNASISMPKLRRFQVIEGRTVKCRQQYTVEWHPQRADATHGMMIDGVVWVPFKSMTAAGKRTVYNLTVDEDNSYTANNAIVHNCTYWSIAQSSSRRETTASGLGWDLFSQYVRALHEAKPKYFLYENNASMSEDIRYQIASTFGFDQIEINSALVSAQNRRRFYWVGVRQEDGSYLKAVIEQPNDRGIVLRDILETGSTDKEKAYCLKHQAGNTRDYFKKHHTQIAFEEVEPVCVAQRGRYTGENGEAKQQMEVRQDGKTNALTTVSKDNSVVEPVNSIQEKSHTIKAQYYKNGVANFICNPGFDAAAVAVPVSCRFRGRNDENGNGFAKCECRDDDKANALDTNTVNGSMAAIPVRIGEIDKGGQGNRIYSVGGKAVSQTATSGGMGSNTGLYAVPVTVRPMTYELDSVSDKDSGIIAMLDMPGSHEQIKRIYGEKGKSPTVVAQSGGNTEPKVFSDINRVKCEGTPAKVYEVKDGMITIKGKEYPVKLRDGAYIIRKLTVRECMRLQTVPEWYDFSAISNSQAYKCLGNGWTIEVIKHLIKSALENGVEPKEQWLFDF